MAKTNKRIFLMLCDATFAERGYDGTTIPMIAEKQMSVRVLFIAILKIKRRLLTHYFQKVCYSFLK